MANYTLTQNHAVKNGTFNGRRAADITKFIIHHWGVKGQSFVNVRNFLCRNSAALGDAPTSASAVLEAGRVEEIAADTTITYHAGHWGANVAGYGIECRPEATAADIETLCQYIADKSRRLGLKSFTIEGHRDYSATACPGDYYAKMNYIINRVNEILAGKPQNATPAPAPAPSTGGKYTVKAGDTLSAIAAANGVSVDAIARASGVTNPNVIHVGQVLTIPGKNVPTRYTVKSGDTLSGIAARYGKDINAIARASGITNINLIHVGQVITIP